MGYEKTLTQGYPSVKQERASFSASGVLVCSGTVVGATERRDYLPLRFSLPIPGRLFSERVGEALIFPLPGEKKRSVPCRHEAVSVRICPLLDTGISVESLLH